MRLARVASTLYGTVLAGGLYFGVAGLAPVVAWRAAVFVAGLLALVALERAGRATLLGRAALIVVVVAADTSGLARVLFLLVPFAVYLTRGRRAGHLAAAGCGVALVGWWTVADPGWPSDREALGDLVMFTVGLVLAVAMAAATVAADADRARAERLVDELAASQQRVAALAAADERNRVARDLHDSLGHHLTAVTIQLEKATAYRARDPDVADQAVVDARASAREALADVRRSVSALRAPPPGPVRTERQGLEPLIDPVGAGAAGSLVLRLDELVARLGSTGVAVTCGVVGDERCSAPVEDVLFRVAQEGLTNALRHSGAGSVSVAVHFAADATTLTVRDDGSGLRSPIPAAVAHSSGADRTAVGADRAAVGADRAVGDADRAVGGAEASLSTRFTRPGAEASAAAASGSGHGSGFGLVGLRERVSAVGGVLELVGEPGAGTTLVARIPAQTALRAEPG
ncbi:sensor histidine kinase [Cryptosporangium arvum]|uniref:sensor histidine kinase n=1 Tax=Cryptosporangium arvum TaxID=80871 RepID=UPI0006842DF5|nr:histidine kinase [Cryptosporangium arvum]